MSAIANSINNLLGPIVSAETVRHSISKQYAHLNLSNLTDVYIFGAGDDARIFIKSCHSNGISISGVLDDNISRLNEIFEGYPIQATKSILSRNQDAVVIITTHRITPATQKLRDLGITMSVPAWVLQILFPDRFPPHMYYEYWAEDIAENAARYKALVGLFADEKSRLVYEAFMHFKLTFDPMRLTSIVDETDEYFPEGVISLGETEVFVDGGAWNGDSIRTFQKKVGNTYSRAYGFEPSTGPFTKLCENFKGDPRVIPVNKGLYSTTTVLKFDADETTASKITETGTIEVPVTALDDVVGNDPVSFIKLNIEGAEACALRGAQKTIQRHMPKMAICVYHKPRDLWELSEIVQDISDGYDFYLRLHDGGVIQLVMYAIPR